MCTACAELGNDLGWAVHWLSRIDNGQAYAVPSPTVRALKRRGLVDDPPLVLSARGRVLLDAHGVAGRRAATGQEHT